MRTNCQSGMISICCHLWNRICLLSIKTIQPSTLQPDTQFHPVLQDSTIMQTSGKAITCSKKKIKIKMRNFPFTDLSCSLLKNVNSCQMLKGLLHFGHVTIWERIPCGSNWMFQIWWVSSRGIPGPHWRLHNRWRYYGMEDVFCGIHGYMGIVLDHRWLVI